MAELHKILLIGPSDAGKTSMISCYVVGNSASLSSQNPKQVYRTPRYRYKEANFEFIALPDQPVAESEEDIKNYYCNAHSILIIIDLTQDRDEWEATVKFYIDKINDYVGNNYPYPTYLVGNKFDLLATMATDNDSSEVLQDSIVIPDELVQIAVKYGLLGPEVCSVRSQREVTPVFDKVIKNLYLHQPVKQLLAELEQQQELINQQSPSFAGALQRVMNLLTQNYNQKTQNRVGGRYE